MCQDHQGNKSDCKIIFIYEYSWVRIIKVKLSYLKKTFVYVSYVQFYKNINVLIDYIQSLTLKKTKSYK